jgi:hypothetical protein
MVIELTIISYLLLSGPIPIVSSIKWMCRYILCNEREIECLAVNWLGQCQPINRVLLLE